MNEFDAGAAKPATTKDTKYHEGSDLQVLGSSDFVSVVVALFTQTRSCSLSNAAKIRGVRPTPVENPGTSGFPWLGT